MLMLAFSSVQFSLSVVSDSLRPHELQLPIVSQGVASVQWVLGHFPSIHSLLHYLIFNVQFIGR